MLRRMPIVVGLSLALISPAQADFEMTFEAQPVEEDADSKAELREAINAYKRDDFLRASLLLYRLLERADRGGRSGSLVGVSGQKAQYFLGKTLYRLGLYQPHSPISTKLSKAAQSTVIFGRHVSGSITSLEKFPETPVF